jgi:WD40 repeat protein
MKLWDAATMQPVAKAEIARNLVTCIRCLHNEPLALQGSEDLTLRIWDARAMASPAVTLGGYSYFPLCVDVSSDNHYAVTGSKGFNGSGCEVRIWDLRMNSQLRVVSGHQQDVTGCRVTGDGHILTACKDGTIGVWNFDSDEVRCSSMAHARCGRVVTR